MNQKKKFKENYDRTLKFHYQNMNFYLNVIYKDHKRIMILTIDLLLKRNTNSDYIYIYVTK